MIRINETYSIASDGVQYKLLKENTSTNKETGETYKSYTIKGYYGSIDDALSGYVRAETMEKVRDDEYDLKTVLALINELKQVIKL